MLPKLLNLKRKKINKIFENYFINYIEYNLIYNKIQIKFKFIYIYNIFKLNINILFIIYLRDFIFNIFYINDLNLNYYNHITIPF